MVGEIAAVEERVVPLTSDMIYKGGRWRERGVGGGGERGREGVRDGKGEGRGGRARGGE
jgi:hypothetical protein